MKNVVKEKANAKVEALKSHLKKKKKNIGRKIPNYKLEFEYERRLKTTAVQGITKLFNAMSQVQKETLDEVVKLGIAQNMKPIKKKNRQNKRGGRGGRGGGRGRGFLGGRF